MNIAYVNDNDLAGRRFNGHDLQILLNNKEGFKATEFVASKLGNNKNTIPLIKSSGGSWVRRKCKEFEESISMQSVIYPFGELLLESKEFQNTDIVHYHLIFNYFLSIYSFKKLVNLKPSIWTLHDPWALTGHCVHPVDCKGWLNGCKNCPHLSRYAPLKDDHASSIWNIKKEIYENIDIDLVVSSDWMYNMVKESPLTKHFQRIHKIPFGIDLDIFKRDSNRKKIRQKFDIKDNEIVLMFRQSDQEWKGLTYIKTMLRNLKEKNIVLLTVGKTGLLDDLKDQYRIIENEWLNNNSKLVELYSASDIFLMPSIAESFGLMAVEAMACSLPVIVFNGTALPDVTFAPECGIAIDKNKTEDFVKVLTSLIRSEEERKLRGQTGRRITEENYSFDRYISKMINLYQEVYKRVYLNEKL